MARGVQLLALAGSFSFIVPPTWLNNKNSAALRRLLLANGLYQLTYVEKKVFETAVVDSVVFFARRGAITHTLNCYTVDNSRTGWTERLTNTIPRDSLDPNAFLPREERVEDAIVQKVMNKCATNLGDVARIVFGIQTRKSASEPNYLHKQRVNRFCKQAVNGKDMGRYLVKPPSLFVEYGDWLWNKRDEDVFKAPQKILIRQVGHYPICALDENQLYSLNTIFNVVVTNRKLSSKYLLALLNSSLIRYIWQHIFPEIKDVFPRVKKEQLVEIPIFIAEKHAQQEATLLVDRILAAKARDASADTSALERQIDQLVYELYGLTPEEIQIVEGAVK